LELEFPINSWWEFELNKSATRRRQRGLVVGDEWLIAASIADDLLRRGLLPKPLDTRLVLKKLAATTVGRLQG